MSNNDTGFIKFLILLLVLVLTSGLSACGEKYGHTYQEEEAENIIGGKSIGASSIFSRRVIYLALTAKNKSGTCTASALSPTILITAAHCVKDLEPSQVSAVITIDANLKSLADKDKISVQKIVIHEDYKDQTKQQGVLYNDLALLKLSQPLNPDRVSQIAVADQTTSLLNLVSIGFGKRTPLSDEDSEINESAPEKNTLYYIMKTVEKFDQKAKTFSINQNDLTGVCSGDSGGPGYIYDAELEDFLIIGVTSYISVTREEKDRLDPKDIYDKCIGHGHYSNILFYSEWISHNISGL